MLSFDFSDFERAARQIKAVADQIPFALARSLNDAAEIARTELAEQTWPSHVTVRNTRFLKAALTTKGNRASKTNLRVAIVDKLGRAHLGEHAKGGTKAAKRRLAIPPSSGFGAVRRTSKGVPAAKRPAALAGSVPKRALRVTSKGIFEGSGGRLNLRYAFASAARIKADVPFEADFQRIMTREVWKAFTPRLQAAMASRRPR